MRTVDDVIGELGWRGLIGQSTDLGELRRALASGPVTFYAGFDPTGPGLHIGHLALMLTMRRLQLAGHRPIGVVGGATGLIGDPSGKSAERTLNPPEVVAEWVARIRGEVGRFIDLQTGMVVSNLEWTCDLSAIALLCDVGKHFSVNRMLDRESVRARLRGSGISFTEFSYQLLQALDFLELYRRHGCTLQVGGGDQWGNLVAGIGLVRSAEGAAVHALAIPLITKRDGTKYGKSEGAGVWLSAELMSPYAFYQFWLNADDAEVPRLLRVFTFRSRAEILALDEAVRDRPAGREGQRVLAEDVTTLVHGAAECGRVAAASRALFGHGELAELDEGTLAAALAEVRPLRIGAGTPDSPPVAGLPAEVLATGRLPAAGLPVAGLMVAAGIAPTLSAARRAIAEGGAYLNNRRVAAADAVAVDNDLLHGRYLVLRRGKRTVGGVEVVGGRP
jgi:tyrosyl-tRNA synthetase